MPVGRAAPVYVPNSQLQFFIDTYKNILLGTHTHIGGSSCLYIAVVEHARHPPLYDDCSTYRGHSREHSRVLHQMGRLTHGVFASTDFATT